MYSINRYKWALNIWFSLVKNVLVAVDRHIQLVVNYYIIMLKVIPFIRFRVIQSRFPSQAKDPQMKLCSWRISYTETSGGWWDMSAFIFEQQILKMCSNIFFWMKQSSWVLLNVSLNLLLILTCRGHSVTLMSPLMPSGRNMVCVAPVVKDSIAFLSFRETQQIQNIHVY